MGKLGRSLAAEDVTVYDAGLTYGTPSQLGHLLASIEQTVEEEPTDQWQDPYVRERAASLRDMLDARLGGMLS